MKNIKRTPEQIVRKLAEGERMLGEGSSVAEMLKKLEISDNTWYRWRADYKGMDINQLKRLKELKEENAKLKAAVADLTLANMVLKEVAEGKL